MNDLKVFKVLITGSFTVYSDAEDFESLCQAVRDKDGEARISIDPVEVDAVQIENIFPDSSDSAGRNIYKLEVFEYDPSSNLYHFQQAVEREAFSDFGDSNLSHYESDPTETQITASWFWQEASFYCRRLLRRFGEVLGEPSSFPPIDAFDSEDLYKRCILAEHLFDYWRATRKRVEGIIGESRERALEKENKLSYFKLRYPGLEKRFETLHAYESERESDSEI